MTRDKYLEALGFTVSGLRTGLCFRNPKINHPGRENRIVNISKSAIPATPPSKGGETYLFINQIIIVVFVFKIFLKLTAKGQ
jgi:hypothetical protein